MRGAAIVAAAGLAVLAGGCGQQTSQRQAVATYLTRVNRVEAALKQPLSKVTTAGSQFAHEQNSGGTLTGLVTGSNEQALLGALSQIRTQGARLAAVYAPPPARHLRSLLLQIVDGQAQLTREVAELVGFLPRYSAALGPLVPASRRLGAALSQQTALGSAAVAAAYAKKAAALRRFKQALDGVATELRGLRPPPVSEPQYETEVASVKGMSSSAGRLAKALTEAPQGNIQQLLLQFDHAATLNQTTSAQKAQIAAIRAYNAQSSRLQQLSQAAEEERLRLANTLA